MKQRREVGEGGKRREQGGRSGRYSRPLLVVLTSKAGNLTASEEKIQRIETIKVMASLLADA